MTRKPASSWKIQGFATLCGNEIYDTVDGISSWRGSTDIRIADNYIHDGRKHSSLPYNKGYGIFIRELHFATEAVYTHHVITNNTIYGYGDGIRLLLCGGDEISHNALYNNTYDGLDLYACREEKVHHNHVLYNGTGLDLSSAEINANPPYLAGSEHNEIYLNNLIGNGTSAQDDVTANFWDNGATGNYFFDYTGVDGDGDGTGDTPYAIGGSGGASDAYPLLEPFPFDDAPLTATALKSTLGVEASGEIRLQINGDSASETTVWSASMATQELEVGLNCFFDSDQQILSLSPIMSDGHDYLPVGTYSLHLSADARAVAEQISIDVLEPFYAQLHSARLRNVQDMAVADFNGDGVQDFFILSSSGYTGGDSLLFLSSGDTYIESAGPWGVAQSGVSFGVCAGDIDNDTWPDLVVCGAAGVEVKRNDGGAAFMDASDMLPALDFSDVNAVALLDADDDGDLELYVVRDGGNHTLLSYQAGAFTEVADHGAPGHIDDIAAECVDFNNDGLTDVLTVGLSGVALYKNTGSCQFQDATTVLPGGVGGAPCYCAAWGDIDNDGDLDLFLAEINPLTGRPLNYLFKNLLMETRDASFQDITADSLVLTPAIDADPTLGAFFFDMKNDGLSDLCQFDGICLSLFQNNGDNTFSAISEYEYSYEGCLAAVAPVDLTGNSVPDLVVCNGAKNLFDQKGLLQYPPEDSINQDLFRLTAFLDGENSDDSTPPTLPEITITDQKLDHVYGVCASSDPESGIVAASVSLGTAPGASNVRAWQEAWFDCGIRLENLSLVQARDYYLNVRVRNGAGEWTDVTSAVVNVAPDIHVQPDALSFGTLTVDDVSPPQVVTVRNDGNHELTVGMVYLEGEAKHQVQIQNDACSSQTIPVGGSATFEVVFAPQYGYHFSDACLFVPSDDPDEPEAVVTLQGKGVPEPDIEISRPADGDLDFGIVTVGEFSDSRSVVVDNNAHGFAYLNITDFVVQGPDAACFECSPAGAELHPVHPNSSEVFNCRFSPDSEGLKQAELVISSDDPDEPTVTVQFQGTGSVDPAPDIAVSPLALDFGTVAVGSSVSKSLTITSQGTADLVIDSVQISGLDEPQYAIEPENCAGATLAPGESCAISVVFSPLWGDTFTAYLSILSNVCYGVSRVTLNGTGLVVKPQIAVTPPDSINFGDIVIGQSATSIVTIENQGNADLVVDPVELFANYPSNQCFSLQNDSCSDATIPPGQSRTLEVVFTPVTPPPGSSSDYSATVIIESNDDYPSKVYLDIAGVGMEGYSLNVSPDPTSGGVITLDPPGGSYMYGTHVTATATPNQGFDFTAWSGDTDGGTIDGTEITLPMTVDRSITAELTAQQYTLTYTAGENGSLSGESPQTLLFGEDGAPVEAVPDEGCHFTQWSDGIADNPRTDTNVTADLDITAEFAVDEYQVIFDLGAYGTRTGGGELDQTVAHGQAALAPEFTVENGWWFTGWDTPFDSVISALSVTAAYAETGSAILSHRGVNLCGAEFGQYTLPGVYGTDYIYPDADTIRYFLGKGMTTIRLPFRWERLQQTLGGELDTDELARLRNTVETITASGGSVILDPHNFAMYDYAQIGTETVSEASFADFWGRLAAQFAGNERVIFGLMNEPHDIQATTWLSAANAAIQAIRNTGAANLILVPGTNWTSSFSWYEDYGYGCNADVMTGIVDPGNNFAVEVHLYFDSDNSGTSSEVVSPTIGRERLADFVFWCRSHGLRGFLGEFGAPATDEGDVVLQDTLNYLEDDVADVFLGWTYWAAGAWWPYDYRFNIQPVDPADHTEERQQLMAIRPFLPTLYQVVFDLGQHGTRTAGGALWQVVVEAGAAISPEIESDAGWEFIGWDAPFDNVTEDLTILAQYQDLEVPDDALPDTWEVAMLGTSDYRGDDDPDGDGLANTREFDLQSHPQLPDGTLVWLDLFHDTDGDGIEKNLGKFAQCVSMKGCTLVERDVEITAPELADFEVLVLYDSEMAFSAAEIAAIQQFCENGSHVLVLGACVDAEDGGQSLRDLLDPYGVVPGLEQVAGQPDTIFPCAVTEHVSALYGIREYVPLTGGDTLFFAGADAVAVAAEHANGGRLVVVGNSGFVKDTDFDVDAERFLGNVLEWFCFPVEYNFDLANGWTVAGLPVASDATINEIFSSAARDSLITGDPYIWSNGEYLALGTDTIPETGYGCWVYSDTGGTCASVTGIRASGELTLNEAWNLISPAEPCVLPNDERFFRSVWTWDSGNQYYVQVLDSILYPGRGYWVFGLQPNSTFHTSWNTCFFSRFAANHQRPVVEIKEIEHETYTHKATIWFGDLPVEVFIKDTFRDDLVKFKFRHEIERTAADWPDGAEMDAIMQAYEELLYAWLRFLAEKRGFDEDELTFFDVTYEFIERDGKRYVRIKVDCEYD